MYEVELQYVQVNDKKVSLQSTYYTVIDSGATLSYFPKALYQEIISSIESHCQLNGCDSATRYVGNGCFHLKSGDVTTSLYEKLPIITLYFPKGPLEFKWVPENYMTVDTSNENSYCLGIYNWG